MVHLRKNSYVNQCCHFWRYIAKSAILDIELAIRIWAWRWIANCRKSAISSLKIGDFGEILKNLVILAISKLSKLKSPDKNQQIFSK